MKVNWEYVVVAVIGNLTIHIYGTWREWPWWVRVPAAFTVGFVMVMLFASSQIGAPKP